MKETLDFFTCVFVFKKTDIQMKKPLSLQLALQNTEFFFFFSFTVRRHEKMVFVWWSGINAGGCSPARQAPRGSNHSKLHRAEKMAC